MAVLITGGAGFIGSHFVERLIADTPWQLVCLDDFNDFYSPTQKRLNIQGFSGHPRVRVIEASFCDPSAMQQLFLTNAIDAVVHLGAYAGIRSSISDPLTYQEINVRGTLVLLEMARIFRVKRFIFCSSSTVYGDGARPPFRENDVLGTPLNPYAATKRAAELLVSTYAKLHGLATVCVRPFSVYGPRLRPDLAMSIFADAIARERPLKIFGDGRALRDFTFVDDVCSGLLATLDCEEAVGETINLGNNQPVEMLEVVRLLEDAIGKEAQIKHCPSIDGDMNVTCADLSKAKQILNYQPRTTIQAGIASFVRWYLPSHDVVSLTA